eukprot:symbB.v1.2.005574.t1/scaffold296.1/size257539/16
MSEKLVKQLADAGLSSLHAVLEHLGILTFSCLGKLNAEELKDTCDRLKAVGFGPGHTCALRMLAMSAAEEDSDSPEKDMATSVTKLLSNKLQSSLRASGLVQIQMVLAQCGVRSCNCLANLSSDELQDLRAALNAAGFKESGIQNDISRGQHKYTGTPEVVENAALTHSAEERPGKYRRLGTPSSWDGAKAEHVDQVMRVLRSFRGRELSDLRPGIFRDSLEEEFRVALTAAVPVEEKFGEPETPTRRSERRPVTSVKGDGEQRLTRQRIEKTLSHSKAIQADIVKYRDKVSGKLVEARVPTAVLALLKLRASCSGKPVSEQKLARMAVDVMEEHAFDPVRAVASLSPSSLLCPTGALRVLGSGFIGIVFLEEETGEVVKVMLDDFAQKEYELCRVFSQAQLGPAPLSLNGPCSVPGGDLYCIRMEPISHTLHGLLCAKTSRGLRHGLSPPQEMNAQRIGSAVVAALQSMHDKGLVHGDLHLHNIGMKDSNTKPTVQLIDFGRSASKAALTGPCGEAFRAGHEYDVCRFIRELCQAFDELQRDFEDVVQECQKELRELKRSKETESPETDWQLHHARQLAGLQAFLDEEPKGLENAELAFNTVLAAVWYYATVKLDMVADGSISVKNRRLRQACKRRESACYKVYFKSDLFWGDCS